MTRRSDNTNVPADAARAIQRLWRRNTQRRAAPMLPHLEGAASAAPNATAAPGATAHHDPMVNTAVAMLQRRWRLRRALELLDRRLHSSGFGTMGTFDYDPAASESSASRHGRAQRPPSAPSSFRHLRAAVSPSDEDIAAEDEDDEHALMQALDDAGDAIAALSDDEAEYAQEAALLDDLSTPPAGSAAPVCGLAGSLATPPSGPRSPGVDLRVTPPRASVPSEMMDGAGGDREAEAAGAIQRLWRRYRDAVDAFETASSAGNAAAAEEAAETIQRRWRMLRLEASRSNAAAIEERERQRESAAHHHERWRTLRRSAVRIQRWWRRRSGGGAMGARDGGGGAGVERRYDMSPTALRVLQRMQLRVRFRRLRQMVIEREQQRAAATIQERWRTLRAVRSHRTAMLGGLRHSAARSVQQAFRAYRNRRDNATPSGSPEPQSAVPWPRPSPPQRDDDSVGADELGLAAAAAAAAVGPVCVICLESTVEVALVPCGHARFCSECAALLARCPCCRRLIAARMRIFL